jgi:pyrroline-5-carboxylate reductase
MTISIIGTGNIGGAIAEGLIDSTLFKSKDLSLYLTRRNTTALKKYESEKVFITTDNQAAIEVADILIIALQPSSVASFFQRHLGQIQKKKPIIASIATNISVEELNKFLHPNAGKTESILPIYRIMPNTAIAVKESMTCISRINHSSDQDQLIEEIFKQVGDVLFIEDHLMNAATVLCACGTAYALRYIRAASQGGTEIGFHAEEALKLAAQTVKGDTELIVKTGQHPEQAIDQVTTPMGCTIAGMNEMEHQGFSSATIKGIRKSYERALNI